MSKPTEQRADGCSIFFTLIIVVLLSSAFIWIHSILQPNEPGDVSLMTDKDRAQKIESHQKENQIFISRINQYHSDQNSSLNVIMSNVVSKYNTLEKNNN
ncbi:MAG: hypothetical protein P8N49_04855 [Opitutales bacterium]|nr:hypothetical protein [Opitutales bacterium]